MPKTVTPQAPPSIVAVPRVDFQSNDFNAIVYNKGLNIIIEKALPCPCSKRTKEFQASCKNCQGTGWIFINPTSTKAIVQSINRSTRYKDWSVELVGTVSLTVCSTDRLNYMDKILVTDSVVIEAENVVVRKYNDTLFSFPVYPVKELEFAFLFSSTDSPLIPLEKSVDYEIQENKIVYLGDKIKEGDSISIRYLHTLQYNILDLNHDVRNSYQLDEKSRENKMELPVSAIARKTHYIMDALNFSQDNIFDNSTIK